MKKNTIINIVLLALGVLGYFFKHQYAGGITTGFAACLVVLSTYGRRKANKAAKIIDKKIKDHYEKL